VLRLSDAVHFLAYEPERTQLLGWFY